MLYMHKYEEHQKKTSIVKTKEIDPHIIGLFCLHYIYFNIKVQFISFDTVLDTPLKLSMIYNIYFQLRKTFFFVFRYFNDEFLNN